MLEIDSLDKTPLTDVSHNVRHEEKLVNRTSGPGLASAEDAQSGYANLLKPIETPLVFSGFSPDTLRLFAKDFRVGRSGAGDGRGLGKQRQAAGTAAARVRRSVRFWCAAT
jgi:hypothetical protein